MLIDILWVGLGASSGQLLVYYHSNHSVLHERLSLVSASAAQESIVRLAAQQSHRPGERSGALAGRCCARGPRRLRPGSRPAPGWARARCPWPLPAAHPLAACLSGSAVGHAAAAAAHTVAALCIHTPKHLTHRRCLCTLHMPKGPKESRPRFTAGYTEGHVHSRRRQRFCTREGTMSTPSW